MTEHFIHTASIGETVDVFEAMRRALGHVVTLAPGRLRGLHNWTALVEVYANYLKAELVEVRYSGGKNDPELPVIDVAAGWVGLPGISFTARSGIRVSIMDTKTIKIDREVELDIGHPLFRFLDVWSATNADLVREIAEAVDRIQTVNDEPPGPEPLEQMEWLVAQGVLLRHDLDYVHFDLGPDLRIGNFTLAVLNRVRRS